MYQTTWQPKNGNGHLPKTKIKQNKQNNKSLLSLTKESGKGLPGKTENFRKIISLLQQNITEELWPIQPQQQKPNGEL